MLEGSMEWYRGLFQKIINDGLKNKINQRDCLDLLLNMREDFVFSENKEVRDYAMKISKYAHEMAGYMAAQTGSGEFDDLYWKYLLLEAPEIFESYLYYMEKNRQRSRRFYENRKSTLNILVQDLQDLEDRKLDFLGVSLPPRVGKLLSDDTPVLTTDGWKNHGDLKVGDYVYDLDGFPIMVTHVFPKNYANKRVWFTDGSYIDCHEKHEWLIYNRHRHSEEIMETSEFENGAESGGVGRGHRYYYQIPLSSAIIGEYKELPVKPYTLGAWLGDGRNNNPDVCEPKEDRCIIDGIVEDGYEISWHTVHKITGVEYYGFKGLRAGLQSVGMCHSRRRTPKHIPNEYFSASIPQRLELLAGLLDTDGTLRKGENRYSFSTTEPDLRDDFVSLVSTFGWRCSVTECEPHNDGHLVNGVEIISKKVYWVISFNPTHEIPCRVERKRLNTFSKQRKVAVKCVEDIEPKIGNCISVQGGIYRAGRRCIPTHNSTLCIFFLSWIMGKRPNSHNAMSGHSGILADGFYGEIQNLILTPEYTFNEIFPHAKLEKKSADKKEINLDKPDRFSTLTCRGIDGTWTGSVDISADGYLYVDDLVRDRMESLSPTRLENRYQDYLNVLVDRKNDGARELMVGTRWNVLDPLGRIESEKKNNPRYRFRKIPALNANGESNFDYDYGVGFSTKYYIDMKSRLDPNEWEAKYQQKPFIREGLLFPADELRTYNGVLPEGDSRIVSACDVAWGGGDALSMPIGREYENGDVYIFDWVFNRGTKEVTLPIVAGKIMGNKIRQINFEANNGGHMYRKYIDEKLQEWNYKCSCTDSKAPGNMEKMSKIIAYSGDIKRKFVFLDEEHRSKEYQEAMDEMTFFVQLGKNDHDDSVDSLSQLERFIENGIGGKATAMHNPLWGGSRY